MLRIWLLGVLRLEADGVELPTPSSRRARLLLAMLALERRAHSREALAAKLWPGVLDESARTSLRTALAQLRSALGPEADRVLEVSRERVALAGPERVWTDVGLLERLLGEGKAEAAVELCAEELLTGLEDEWVYERRDELRGRFSEALARRADEAEAGDDLQTALRLSRRQAALDPLAEEPQRQLIRRLAAAGDRSAALSAYERLAERLRAELRTVPSAPTRRLAEALRAGAAPASKGDDSAAPGDDTVPAAAPGPAPGELPSGVVSFLLTDIEGSSGLWEADPEAMAVALELHDQLIVRGVEAHGGRLLKQKGEGDATLAVFRRASEALACAAQLEAALAGMSWPGGLELRVRIALHTGEAHERQGDYFGPALNRAARLRSLARGGMTVVSQATAEIVRDRLPRGARLVDLGPRELHGLTRPERVFELRSRAGAPLEELEIEPVSVGLPLPRPLRGPAGCPVRRPRRGASPPAGSSGRRSPGERAAAFLAGEPGIGKTRLAASSPAPCRRRGRSSSTGAATTASPCPTSRSSRRSAPREGDRTRSPPGRARPPGARPDAALPELEALGEPLHADPETERYRLFEAVTALLEAATREQRGVARARRPALGGAADAAHAAPSDPLRAAASERSSSAPTATTELVPPITRWPRLLADLQRDASATETWTSAGSTSARSRALLEARGRTRARRTRPPSSRACSSPRPAAIRSSSARCLRIWSSPGRSTAPASAGQRISLLGSSRCPRGCGR